MKRNAKGAVDESSAEQQFHKSDVISFVVGYKCVTITNNNTSTAQTSGIAIGNCSWLGTGSLLDQRILINSEDGWPVERIGHTKANLYHTSNYKIRPWA